MSRAPWRPDTDVVNCVVCEAKFGFFRGKHHCRACGEVVCKSCLPAKVSVPGYNQPELTCKLCIPVHQNSANASVVGSPSRHDVQRIQQLCQTFQSRIMTDNTANISKVAQAVMQQAQQMSPAPFNAVFVVANNLLGLSINAVVNTAESCRLADRVARLSFAVLQLSVQQGNFHGAAVVSSQLTKVFTMAVELLERFQPDPAVQRSFIDIIKSKFTLYSASSVKQFDDIHQQLTVIMQDRAFMLSVSDEALMQPPSMIDIQEGIHSEVNHVITELKKHSLESGSRFDHIDAQLQTVLSTLSTGRAGRRDVAILDPCSLQIDTTCVLGKGASGTVYAGTLYGTTEVAVKILSTSDDAAVEALRRELERTVRVAHRNVIKVYGIVEHCSIALPGKSIANPPAVITERLGTTLEPVLGKLTPSQAMKLTLDIIMGMARVHDLEDGVIHFDLKPQNVLLSLDGRTAVISDFGIAQSKTTVAYASAAENTLVRGTVAYMAPEILLGTSRSFACDVYSFSVMLFALWTGRVPWQGFADSTIITAVQQGSRPAVDLEMIAWGVPEPIVALIVACWDQSPGNRPSFKTMLQLREIDMFWEAPVSRWPAYLAAVMHTGSPLRVDDISFTTSSTTGSMPTLSSKGSASTNSRVGALMSATAVGSLSPDQLCEYLRDSCNIDRSVVNWLQEKNINGDVFLASGHKLVDRLRQVDIDEWHVDALERCHAKHSAAADAEQTRQQQLLEARQTMANSTKAAAQAEAARKEKLEEARLQEEARAAESKLAEETESKKAAGLTAKQAASKRQADFAAAKARDEASQREAVRAAERRRADEAESKKRADAAAKQAEERRRVQAAAAAAKVTPAFKYNPTDPAAAVYALPQFAKLGRALRSSGKTSLAEEVFEYEVSCVKHIFTDHVVLQFNVSNDFEDEKFYNVRVNVEGTDPDALSVYTVETVVPAAAVVLSGETTSCFVSLKRSEGMYGSETMSCTMTYENDGESFFFSLDDLDVSTGDLMAGVSVDDFRSKWDAMGTEGEEMGKFATIHQTKLEAVAMVIESLGMQVVDGTVMTTAHESKSLHILHLAGVLLGNIPVLARAQVQMNDDNSGVILKLAVRSRSTEISQALVDCIV